MLPSSASKSCAGVASPRAAACPLVDHLRRCGRGALIALAACAATAQAACPLEPPHFRVGANTTYCTHPNIQAAIEAASATCPTIIEVTREHLYSGGYCNPNQSNGCHLTVSGKNVTLQGRADGETCYVLTQCIPGPSCPAPSSTVPLVTLDGNYNGRVLSISGASTVNLRNLTITHGDAGGGDGGGIGFTGSGNLNITRTTIATNHAGYGGGINANGTAALKLRLQADTLLQNNTAEQSGGGVRIEGATRLYATSDHTLILLNHALAGYGGGIEILGPARADIGSPGYSGAGVVSNNDGVYGGGIAVVDNGNGEGVLRTFADAVARPTEIESNAAVQGGGVYVSGLSSACLLATTLDKNNAGDGAALYYRLNDAANGGGIYFNDGWPSRLGAECGPEAVSALGGSTVCAPYASECNAITDNYTDSPSAGSIVFDQYGDTVLTRVQMRGNTAGTMLYLHSDGFTNLNRLLLVDNAAAGYLADIDAGRITNFRFSTIAGNSIGANYVLNLNHSQAYYLNYEIFAQPGKLTALWDSGNSFAHLYAGPLLTNDSSGLLSNDSREVVVGTPQFVDAAHGDYHLAPTAQTSLDYGYLIADQSFFVPDLDGFGWPPVDLPGIPNKRVGSTADLGVYERQNLGYNCGTADSVFCDRFDR
jgi:hypothetical protein